MRTPAHSRRPVLDQHAGPRRRAVAQQRLQAEPRTVREGPLLAVGLPLQISRPKGKADCRLLPLMRSPWLTSFACNQLYVGCGMTEARRGFDLRTTGEVTTLSCAQLLFTFG